MVTWRILEGEGSQSVFSSNSTISLTQLQDLRQEYYEAVSFPDKKICKDCIIGQIHSSTSGIHDWKLKVSPKTKDKIGMLGAVDEKAVKLALRNQYWGLASTKGAIGRDFLSVESGSTVVYLRGHDGGTTTTDVIISVIVYVLSLFFVLGLLYYWFIYRHSHVLLGKYSGPSVYRRHNFNNSGVLKREMLVTFDRTDGIETTSLSGSKVWSEGLWRTAASKSRSPTLEVE